MSNKIAPKVFIVGAESKLYFKDTKLETFPVNVSSSIITGYPRPTPRATKLEPSVDKEHPVMSVIAEELKKNCPHFQSPSRSTAYKNPCCD